MALIIALELVIWKPCRKRCFEPVLPFYNQKKHHLNDCARVQCRREKKLLTQAWGYKCIFRHNSGLKNLGMVSVMHTT